MDENFNLFSGVTGADLFLTMGGARGVCEWRLWGSAPLAQAALSALKNAPPYVFAICRAACISVDAHGDSDAARLNGEEVPELSDKSSILRSGGGWLFCVFGSRILPAEHSSPSPRSCADPRRSCGRFGPGDDGDGDRFVPELPDSGPLGVTATDGSRVYRVVLMDDCRCLKLAITAC